MKNNLKKVMQVALLFAGVHVGYADTFYCTQTNQYINTGMTTDQVQQACGAPANVNKSQEPVKQRIPVEEISFNVSTNAISNAGGTVTPGVNSGAFTVNTGPMTTLMVTAQDQKIVSISLNGQSVQSASICGGGSFSVGDPPSNAVSSCGNPAFVNNSFKSVSTDQTMEVQVWSYTPTTYQPPFTLTFQNGMLATISGSGN